MDYIEMCKENMALQQENKRLKEKISNLRELLKFQDIQSRAGVDVNEMWGELCVQAIKENQNLQEQLAITEKALKLACIPRNDWHCTDPKRIRYDNNYDYFIDQAKESMK